ncbi:hypothetical protein, conserved [Plasmodium gonderi]|uniref:Uncharacterized protein n=1 Tax=Plasmodium gonderi TaxID=77519 RepID=A0A1Y1JJW8_PLAGO|nr:hypothetical protein, conserved [Plasmodium gonderi]GAW81705.1 hypothetical protein, conserved [Plasmodium gonderi]
MSTNIKDLIKQEKERRKLLREERKKTEKVIKDHEEKREKENDGGGHHLVPKKLTVRVEDRSCLNDSTDNHDTKGPHGDKLFLKIQNNYEHSVVTEDFNHTEGFDQVEESDASSRVTKNAEYGELKKSCYNKIPKMVHFSEPLAPLNRLNKNNNFKDAFLDYRNEKNSEYSDVTSKYEHDNKQDKVEDLPADFFDIQLSSNPSNSERNNEKSSTSPLVKTFGERRKKSNEFEALKEEECSSMINVQYKLNEENTMYDKSASSSQFIEEIGFMDKQNEKEFHKNNETDVEVIETYEIIENVIDSTEIIENEKFQKKIKKKRKMLQGEEYQVEGRENDEEDIYQNRDIIHRSGDGTDTEEEQNSNHVMNIINTNLDDLTNYKMLDTAYFEELDYLHKILVEKKKYILGDSYNDEKEENEEMEMEILEELNEFHKKKKKIENRGDDKSENDNNFNIDEIYELLNLKRGQIKNEGPSAHPNTPNVKRIEEYPNNGKKTNEYENLPRGFFDDKEKDILVRENISLHKINQKIGEIKKQKKNILLEYKTLESVYEEKKNNYIDYLYDDKFDDKEHILNEIKIKSANLQNLKKSFGSRGLDGESETDSQKGIQRVKKKKKKKNSIRKKSNKYQLYDEHGDIFDWKKKSPF